MPPTIRDVAREAGCVATVSRVINGSSRQKSKTGIGEPTLNYQPNLSARFLPNILFR